MATNTTEIVPTGAIRYNTDSNKMECFNGTKWMQVSVSSPDLNGGARGFRAGAQTGGASPWPMTDRIDYMNITSAGNAIDFGNLTATRFGPAGASSRTRGLFIGGGTPTRLANVDYFTMSSLGNAADFGDMTDGRASRASAHSNQTRAIWCAGADASVGYVNIIDYITIASTGDGVDFGDLTFISSGTGAAGSSTRELMCGGGVPGGSSNVIQYITLSTTGNAQDFGDMVEAASGMAVSNSTRVVASSKSTASTSLDTVIISTLGNSIEFGDLTTAQANGGAFANSSKLRGLFGLVPSGGDVNTIDYISMATGGTAADFGDSTQVIRNSGGTSNDHGGL